MAFFFIVRSSCHKKMSRAPKMKMQIQEADWRAPLGERVDGPSDDDANHRGLQVGGEHEHHGRTLRVQAADAARPATKHNDVGLGTRRYYVARPMPRLDSIRPGSEDLDARGSVYPDVPHRGVDQHNCDAPQLGHERADAHGRADEVEPHLGAAAGVEQRIAPRLTDGHRIVHRCALVVQRGQHARRESDDEAARGDPQEEGLRRLDGFGVTPGEEDAADGEQNDGQNDRGQNYKQPERPAQVTPIDAGFQPALPVAAHLVQLLGDQLRRQWRERQHVVPDEAFRHVAKDPLHETDRLSSAQAAVAVIVAWHHRRHGGGERVAVMRHTRPQVPAVETGERGLLLADGARGQSGQRRRNCDLPVVRRVPPRPSTTALWPAQRPRARRRTPPGSGRLAGARPGWRRRGTTAGWRALPDSWLSRRPCPPGRSRGRPRCR
eukprot:scaffold17217_cov134-Isochrysis_galbana.AAC.3